VADLVIGHRYTSDEANFDVRLVYHAVKKDLNAVRA
jgi:hypothetical protein